MWTRELAFVVCAALFVPACGVNTIVNNIDEKQANRIVVILADNKVDAKKREVTDGRNVAYSISVATKYKLEALRVLDSHDLPHRIIKGYDEVFGEAGLIPTAAEEKAKKLSAIEGEIEKQLRLINGVLDVEVNIVMPEESPLRTSDDATSPTTASVTVKYLPGKGGAKPLTEPQIRAVVAAGVEKLTPDHVVVVMTPAGRAALGGDCPECAPAGRGILGRLTAKGQNMVLFGVVILVLILSLGLVFGQIRLKTVRGRLIRLQNEIARARRKSDVPATQ